ncbi:MAG: omp-alpha 4 [Firmicutes bacterium]|nr:omp-alpha 4 [Bacillota bacterium]
MIALCAVFSLSMAGTSLAAPANLFAVVPEKHWAYSAISQLAEAGLVKAFDGGAYKENVILMRCEMAAIVAKAMAKSANVDAAAQATIEKLKAEFAPEFNLSETNNVASRLDKLEKNASPIKITNGDVRIRYQSNWDQKIKNTDKDADTRIQERVRLNIAADITDNLKFNSRLAATHTSNKRAANGTSKSSTYANPAFDRAELQWKNKQTTVAFGRIVPSLGQGIIWDGNSIDGAYATYDFGNAQA